LLAVSAAPANATIVPQDNIAGVEIDMTQEKVLEVLGSPGTTITRRGGGCACVPVTTYTYKRRGIKVLFKPNRANTANITFAIEVYRDRGQRTAEGIGIGSPAPPSGARSRASSAGGSTRPTRSAWSAAGACTGSRRASGSIGATRSSRS
jgi:hypothetical protein